MALQVGQQAPNGARIVENLGDYSLDENGGQWWPSPPGRPAAYPVRPGQMGRFSPPLVPQADIVPGVPTPGPALPQTILPRLDASMTRRELAGVLDSYRNTYQPWWYGFQNLSLAIGGSSSESINLHPDSFFVCTQWLLRSSIAAPDFTIQVQDTGGGQQLFQTVIFNSLITGNGQRPYYLPREWVLAPNTTILLTVADRASAGVQVIDFQMAGYKVYVTERDR